LSQHINLACAADARYVAHSAAMLHSALTLADRQLVVHYLHGPDLPRHERTALASMFVGGRGEIVFHEIADRRVAGLPGQDRYGAAMWYRTLLAEVLPDVQRVLYLDVDTIVTDQVEPLFALDLGEHLLGAVTNVFMEYHRDRLEQFEMAPSEYFNSGVVLMNLAAIRESGFTAALLDLVRAQGHEFLWPDQDALNVVARGRWLRLHPRWNCMNSFFSRPRLAEAVFGNGQLAEATARPAIRHFEGPDLNKPWHLLHSRSGQRLYRRHRMRTPWPHYSLVGQTAGNRVRRVIADVRAHTHPGRSTVRT
jgi:lipopolysaccharide biosynthesis glycosyltransferase